MSFIFAFARSHFDLCSSLLLSCICLLHFATMALFLVFIFSIFNLFRLICLWHFAAMDLFESHFSIVIFF